jgi:hypothetical protein
MCAAERNTDLETGLIHNVFSIREGKQSTGSYQKASDQDHFNASYELAQYFFVK